MADLEQWLRAQLDEDERTARAADDSLGNMNLDWVYQPEDELGGKVVSARGRDLIYDVVAGIGKHTAEHDPRRVLREIDAKRQLLDLHGLVHRDLIWLDETGEESTAEIPVCGHCVPRHSSFPRPSAVPQGPCTTLRLLALPYADRPGYRPGWRP